MKWLFAALLVLLSVSGALAGSLTLLGAGSPGGSGGGAYAGPGDVTSFVVWGSVARVYNLASASTSTNLADLVATSGGAAVCTLRGSTSGFVDLASNYCAGTTPDIACFNAAGGTCSVSKLYDQTGNGRHLTQATLSQMPVVLFGATINGYPAMVCTDSANTSLKNTSISQTRPWVWALVSMRTSLANQVTYAETAGGPSLFENGSTPNSIKLYNGGAIAQVTAIDSAFNAVQTGGDASTTFITAQNNTGTTGSGPSNVSGALTLCSTVSATHSLDGQILEFGLFAGTFSLSLQSQMEAAYGL